jgi:hypothetical protein
VLVQLSLSVDPIFLAIVDQEHRLLVSFYLLLGQTHDVSAEVAVAHDLQVLVVLVEQIVNAFIVDFKIRNPDVEVRMLVLLL